jgi:hypothetical protein
MENFISGFPGRECQIRAALLKVLGQEKYDFFFDKYLDYFFTDKDGEFLASLGFNCLRLSFNYRHFEDDMNPFVMKEEGFKRLDKAIDIVSHRPSFFTSRHSDWKKSAPDTASTPFSTSMPLPAARIRTGTATTRPDTPPSGTTSTSKTG